jgi:plasmid stabilization system protein ParE
MKTNQSNYLKMAITTDDVCAENEASWSSLPAFASEIALARTHIASIRQDGQAQLGADSKPHTQAKDEAKQSLARLAADTGAPASVYAETTGNQPAATQLNQSYSDIYYATDLDAENLAVNLLAAARAMDATALANYGVTAARLDDLEDALDHYSEKIGSPRAATVKRRVRTLSLEDLFDKLRAVHSRMDRLAAVFRTTAPDFFAAYETARVIIDRPATQEGEESPTPPAQ